MISCRITILCVVYGFTSVSIASEKSRPNLVVIVADDLGYSDLRCYGGEIDTPEIDRLAFEGVRFTNFRATPMCSTSRVALMSGSPFDRAGGLSYSNSAPLAAVLRGGGYRTMMIGKWHAGDPDPCSGELFDRSFGFLGGMTDCFQGSSDWFLDKESFDNFDQDFYATRTLADHGVDFLLEAAKQEKPFFFYAAFNAPHHPCQAPQKTYQKYVGRYLAGYEAMRKQRLERQISLGITAPGTTLPPSGPEVRKWQEIPKHRRVVEDARMAAYAASVDELDQAVGKIVECLRRTGQLDKTLLVFLSDNGADYNNGALPTDERQTPWEKGTNPAGSNGWATVKNTPYRGYKHTCYEGGLATPLIIRWPKAKGVAAGEVLDDACHITDLYPTLLEAAGIQLPGSYAGHGVIQPTGVSLLPLLTQGDELIARPIYSHYRYSRSWIENHYKAVQLYGGPWQLFDIQNDRTETADLSIRDPNRLQQYISKWQSFAEQAGVPPESDSHVSQRGWGWHRLKMVSPNLKHLTPGNSSVTSSCDVDLLLEFDKPLDFRGTAGKSIRLYSVSNETHPIWQADPNEASNAQGSQAVSFRDLPTLEPDQGYFVLWDRGWLRSGGDEIEELNDGAFWWRFRTPP